MAMNDLQQLTAAAKEAAGMLDPGSEAAGILNDAIADHGYKTAVPRNPASVGTCSLCDGDVVRTPGKGAACPCGFVMIPETFKGVSHAA